MLRQCQKYAERGPDAVFSPKGTPEYISWAVMVVYSILPAYTAESQGPTGGDRVQKLLARRVRRIGALLWLLLDRVHHRPGS